jgi:hypothetical protein
MDAMRIREDSSRGSSIYPTNKLNAKSSNRQSRIRAGDEYNTIG